MLLEEKWLIDGHRHRANGERAAVQFDERSGHPFMELWMEQGEYHRDGDLPAVVKRWPSTGSLYEELWYDRGLRHRDNGRPSMIRRSQGGAIVRVEFSRHGLFHRAEGPAVITFDHTGERIRAEKHYLNGLPVGKPRARVHSVP